MDSIYNPTLLQQVKSDIKQNAMLPIQKIKFLLDIVNLFAKELTAKTVNKNISEGFIELIGCYNQWTKSIAVRRSSEGNPLMPSASLLSRQFFNDIKTIHSCLCCKSSDYRKSYIKILHKNEQKHIAS